VPDEFEEYNPLDYKNLTVNLLRELMNRGPYPLPPSNRFPGAGVYALFYVGESPVYASISSSAALDPVYVGKAIPKGSRKGLITGASAPGHELFSRLQKHRGTIAATKNLELEDFRCRFLVVNPLWISMAERLLIEEFQPPWNMAVDGFGLNPPGSKRMTGMIPWWHALHPGGLWSSKMEQLRSQEEAETRLRDFFARKAADPEAVRREALVVADLAADVEG
jgi:hypothetical protein